MLGIQLDLDYAEAGGHAHARIVRGGSEGSERQGNGQGEQDGK